jgi:hypothetical protein
MMRKITTWMALASAAWAVRVARNVAADMRTMRHQDGLVMRRDDTPVDLPKLADVADVAARQDGHAR